MSAQLDLPFHLDDVKLAAFLTQWLTIEAEEERLREAKRLLKEDYADHMPLRAVLTAVKVTRARHKLAAHAKEPMQREYQTHLEGLVEQHLAAMEVETRDVVDLTTGEVMS